MEQTIRSVLNQTYQDWEWILLDDGSTDATGDIIKRFKDSRIRYHVQEHAGSARLAATFNNALALCSGDFIALLDGDDYWQNNEKLKIQINSLQEPEFILSYGEAALINQGGKRIGYMSIPKNMHVARNDPVGSSLELLLLQRYCFLPNSTILLRKKALDDIGGFVEAPGLNQDFPTWTELSLEGKFAPIPFCVACWRRHISSSNFNTAPERLFDAGIVFLKDFVLRQEKKLRSLGLSYHIQMLEKHWEGRRREHLHYLPYNRAMLMLRLGLFKNATVEFRKFKEKHPSAKSALIHAMIHVSRALHIDVVNPVAALKNRLKGIFRDNE